MNLSLYCSVAEAAEVAGVSEGYIRRLLRDGKLEGEKIGNTYLVFRASIKKFDRQPGMGRPPKAARKRPRKPGK